MITTPKHKYDSPAKLQDVLIETNAGMLNAKDSAYYHIKDLDYKTLPLQSSKFFVYTGKNQNNIIENTLNTVWIRWKDRVVILIESTELSIDDKVTVYLADISEEHETITVSGTAGNNYVDVPGGVTTAVFLKKFLRITGTGDDTDSIYTIDYYDTNKLYLKENLNNNISSLEAKIISKVAGSTHYWKDVPIQSVYDTVKGTDMGDSDLGVFNLDPGPASSFAWPSAITKSGTTIFYVILQNDYIFMEEAKNIIRDLSTENIEMESRDVNPGVSIFDMYKYLENVATYANVNPLFFNEVDMDPTNWELYSYHRATILSIGTITSVYTSSYKITVTSSALISEDDDYYLYYKPYNIVYQGIKINGTTVDFTTILPYNMKSDLSTSALFGNITSSGTTYLVADYLRLQRNFILAPRSKIFALNDELTLQDIQIYFTNGTYTGSTYTLGTPVDLSVLSVDKYVLYAKIRNGSTKYQHSINIMGLVTLDTFTTNRLTTYGDCIVIGMVDKYGASQYYLTIYGTYTPSFSKLETYNVAIEGTVAISNVVSYHTGNSQWEKTLINTIPQGICEDDSNNIIVFDGEANIPGLTVNTWYYLDDVNAGVITTSPNSGIQVGYALSADRLLLDFRLINDSSVVLLGESFDTGSRVPSNGNALDYDTTINKWRTCTANTLPFAFLNGINIIFSGLTVNPSGFGLTPGQVYYQHATNPGELTTSNTGFQVGICLETTIFLVQIRKV